LTSQARNITSCRPRPSDLDPTSRLREAAWAWPRFWGRSTAYTVRIHMIILYRNYKDTPTYFIITRRPTHIITYYIILQDHLGPSYIGNFTLRTNHVEKPGKSGQFTPWHQLEEPKRQDSLRKAKLGMARLLLLAESCQPVYICIYILIHIYIYNLYTTHTHIYIHTYKI